MALNEENTHEKDLVWNRVSDALLQIVHKNSADRSPEERRTLRAMSFKLLHKLEHGTQAWEDISPDVWVYLDKKVKSANRWKPILHL